MAIFFTSDTHVGDRRTINISQRPFASTTEMNARRAVGRALRAGNEPALIEARRSVDAAKVALGERGSVWWDDGAPDLTRRMARDMSYAAWHAGLEEAI